MSGALQSYPPSKWWDAGFGPELVSVVPPGAPIAEGCSLAGKPLGKVPGLMRADGLWVGYRWREAVPNRENVAAWTGNLGLKGTRFVGLDIDVTDASLADAIERIVRDALGPAPCRRAGGPKRLLLYRTDRPVSKQRLEWSGNGGKHAVEALGDGQQFLVSGVHPSGAPYIWGKPHPVPLGAAALTCVTPEQIDTLMMLLREYLAFSGVPDATESKSGERSDVPQDTLRGDLEDVRTWVAAIPNNTDRSGFIRMGSAIKASLPDHPGEAEELFGKWCARWSGGTNAPEYVAQTWRSLRPPFQLGAAWLRDQARKAEPSLVASAFDVADAPRHLPASPDRKRARAASRRLIDVQPETITWLSPGRIPFGKLTVLEGDPGLGKSTVLLDLAARLTRGEGLPGDPAIAAADVILLTAEDGIADTVVPRLIAAQADLSRVHDVTGVVDAAGVVGDLVLGDPKNPASMEALEGLVEAHRARLVIVDVLTAFLSGARDSYKDHDIRQALRPLSSLAERTGCAIIVVRHLRKSRGGGAINAGGGSIGIGGAARSVLLVDRDPEDDEGRILASVKCNVAKPPPSLRFHIVSTPSRSSRIEWRGESHVTAEALTAERDQPEAGARSKKEECAACLTEWLTPDGMERKEVLRRARDSGFSGATVERARRWLGVLSGTTGFGANLRAWWSLPPSAFPAEKDAASVLLEEESAPTLDDLLGTPAGTA